jgi:hypothetical protein
MALAAWQQILNRSRQTIAVVRLPRNFGGDLRPEATSSRVQLREASAETFDDVADEVPGPNYAFGQLPAGSYEARIAGRNADGLGPWSAPASFTVPG